MKRKKWIVSSPNPGAAQSIERELGLGALAAKVLAARGAQNAHDAGLFIDTSLEKLNDPFELCDMQKGVDEIEKAIAAKDKIAIYGDYDVDGVTATCILIKYLRSRGAECTYYIPDRLGEGYGLNRVAIQSLYDDGCRLLITVDSGITAVEEADFAAEIGLRLIITDHHECKEKLPAALAVINPRRQDNSYPFRELAGVGVAFKLICALEKNSSINELMEQYGDIVAVGTIADVMPIVGENRSIVAKGLAVLERTKNQGLRALMQKLGLDVKPVNSNSVSFVMAPRINAAGRMGGAAKAAQMFLTEDVEEAQQLADTLCELNRLRQEEENGIHAEITSKLEQNPHLVNEKILVLWGDNWHNGVIGIVASRLADKYGVPCVLISIAGDNGKGSGRSIKGFNLYAALEQNSQYLDKYGGHELAVGISIDRSNLEQFKQSLCRYAAEMAQDGDVVPTISVDCYVEPTELTTAVIEQLSAIEPFGMGNPQPAFIMEEVRLEEVTPISHDRHVKMLLSKNGKTFFAFAFGMGARSCPYVKEDVLDIVFSAEINHYKGNKNVQLVIKDVHHSGMEEKIDSDSFNDYRVFARGDELNCTQASAISPGRDDLVAVFRHIKSNCESSVLCASVKTLYRRVRYESRRNMNLGKFLVCMDVFEEFSIFRYDVSGEDITINVMPSNGKVDINGSKVLKLLMDMRQHCGGTGNG